MEIVAGFDIPLWSILLVIAAFLGYIYSTWTYNTWSMQGIKGFKPYPIVGTFIASMKAGGGSFAIHDAKTTEMFGKISGSYRSRTPILDVADPEFLRLSMVKDFNSMPNRNESAYVGNIMDCFMTALTDDHWRHVRSSLSPTFTSGRLKQLKERIDCCADQFVKYISETNGEPFELKKMTGCFTMDTISSTAFGIEIDSLNDPEHPMIRNANKMMNVNVKMTAAKKFKLYVKIFVFLLVPSFLQRILIKYAHLMIDMDSVEYFEGVTSQIISHRELDETKQRDFVQLCVGQLIEDPKLSDPATQLDRHGRAWSTKGLTKDEIIANAILFYMAGYETTALTLHYVLYELTVNPDIQEKVYAEIMESKSSDVATYDELSKMKYIEWVINETMRIYPAAPRVERQVTKDTTIEGIFLPAGSMVSAMIYSIHHDPEIWPEPDQFDPERFSPENQAGRHQYAWIPFGLGNRNCIGKRLALLMMKVALVKILTNFELEACAETPKRPLTIAKTFRMEPESIIKLTVKRRE